MFALWRDGPFEVMLREDHLRGFGMSGDHLLSSAQDLRASQLRPQTDIFVLGHENVAGKTANRGLLLGDWVVRDARNHKACILRGCGP